MSGSTTKWGLPFPGLADPADVPRWIEALASALDTVGMDFQGTLANRPAAAKSGRYYYATDNGRLYRDDGTTWREIPYSGKIDTDKLADDAITQAKLADDAVGSAQILAAAVGTAELASASVTPAKMGTVDFSQIRRNTGNISVAAATETTITWDTQDYDPEDLWVAGSPTILTLNRTGVWGISANIVTDVASPNTTAKLRIKCNGVTIGTSPNGDAGHLFVSRTRRFTTADIITITYEHNDATHNITPTGEFPHVTALYHGV